MTHDELLAKVNKDIEDGNWYDKTAVFNFLNYANALCAVLKLHYQQNEGGYCDICSDFEYPCKTIQAIEKELK